MNIIQERMENFIQDFFGLDMLELGLEQWLEKGRQGFAKFQLECAQLELEMLDETLFETPSIRPGWNVVRKAPRTLVTHYGTLEFTRRYYHHAQTGARAHLVDGTDRHNTLRARGGGARYGSLPIGKRMLLPTEHRDRPAMGR